MFRLILLDEAKDFIADLPESVAEKIRYNIHRVIKDIAKAEAIRKYYFENKKH